MIAGAVAAGSAGRGFEPGGVGEDEAAASAVGGEAADRPEEHERAAPLAEPGPVAGAAGDDDRPAAHGGADGVAGVEADRQAAGPQPPAGAVGGLAGAEDRQARRVEVGGQLGPGVAVDLDHRLPGAGQAADEQSLALDARQAEPAVAGVERDDQLAVDPLVVPDQGDRDLRDGRRPLLHRSSSPDRRPPRAGLSGPRRRPRP